MLGDRAAKKTDIVPFSNNTFSQRINDMSSYAETTVVQWVKKTQYYALQIDESMDVANLAILLVLVRYINEDMVSLKKNCCFAVHWNNVPLENIHQTHKCLLCWKRNRFVSLHKWGHTNDGWTYRICSSDERDSNKRLSDSLLYP
jgi:hypothetical protein